MNMNKKKLLVILGLLLFLLLFCLESLANWGLGILTINVFNIDYIWTFKHGMYITFMFMIISSFLKRK